MGSNGNEYDKRIDAKVGGLVWVRRRNGSWWPGKILSPDEIPDGRAAVPRSGTPVKLLGKKGASVDWYNLEKSKRVKAFHCGEYEDCIEKAKLSASHISNKGVTKARREDAIIHALELETSLLGPRKVHDSIVELHPTEEFEHHKRNWDLLNSEDREPEKLKTPNDSEEDVSGVKRMRGLEDLGVPSSLKRKRSQVAHECSKRKNRHRPLTKVLECSTMLSSPLDQFPCRIGLSDETMNTVSVEIINEADGIGFVYGNGTLKDPSMQQHEVKDYNLSCLRSDDESSQNLFDVPLMVAVSVVNERIESSSTSSITEKPASEWQTKRKRNLRFRNPKSESIASPSMISRYDSIDISDSCLYNVVIEVKSSYQTQHVPYISLMSKTNNISITGHPLTVEVLENGSCESEISRTKSTKSRKVGILSKKTRKLSSLSNGRGFSREMKKKPAMENMKSTCIACIPIKIVFSRINAALSKSYRPALPRLAETNGT